MISRLSSYIIKIKSCQMKEEPTMKAIYL